MVLYILIVPYKKCAKTVTFILLGYSTMHSLLGYPSLNDEYVPNKIVKKIFIFVEFGTVLLLSANIGQCQIQNFHFSRYLIGGGNVVKFRIHHLRNKLGKLPHVFNHHQNVTLEVLDFHITFSALP